MKKFIYTALFSFSLSFIISAWVTYINIGLTANFLEKWQIAFLNAWPAAFVCAYLLAPIVAKATHYLIQISNKIGNKNA